MPEALGRELIRTYIEAPHYENILLAAAQGGFGPATGRSGRSSEVSYAPNTHSIVYRAGYLPLEVPIPTNSPRAISQNRRSLQYDFTPRVVDGANFAYPQAVQTNPATSWRLQGRRPKDGGGRIPGATNHTYHSGRIVGATNRTRSPGLQPSQGPSSTNSTTNRASQVYQAFHLEGTEPVDSEADHNHAHPIDENDNDLFYNPAVDS